MICTGAKTISDCRNAAMKYAAIITKVGYQVQFNDFKVQNITATSDAGFPIRLEALIFAMPKNCTYEPELFPGLIYRMITPKVVLLIFVSGKLVLTGAKKRSDIYQAFNNIYAVLCLFKKS
jgi:transcription initiation factor TFIID TATA-box-binding protein